MFIDNSFKMGDESCFFMHKGSPEFIEKLYQMLEDPTTDKFIRWNVNGLSFLIINPPEFARKVLENHFKHGNLSSFVRQLNKYDFHKIKSSENILETFGNHVWEFKNDHFQRNRRDLMFKIKRKRSTSERNMRNSIDSFSLNGDTNTVFQNQSLSTLKVITRYFQVIIEDINELKSAILQGKQSRRIAEKILVCEDNINCSSFAGGVLSKLGFSVILAETEDEASIRIETEKFDVYFISSLLNNSSNLIRKIRQINPDAQIVVIVDNNFKQESVLYLNLGANDVLMKPYIEETLVHIMNNCLENKKRLEHWHKYPTDH
ncbi:hypothetical protein EDEG_00778 [Edhazardia aedis USNM 41457]|uniref:Response regulatory domain-containing protein n=1 Tax=Edhazardia aedis (strain USNM 41457) TaxID=1003232 RepID=J9DBN1_EDHAE|nr:hypothetical protein EDEG_00778 [Edhazardia aedis USNM 41457]|eukprot:EJW05131.1 hypothetical protein EDEG_00778 [Edhazardia aedis USNM 41457]